MALSLSLCVCVLSHQKALSQCSTHVDVSGENVWIFVLESALDFPGSRRYMNKLVRTIARSSLVCLCDSYLPLSFGIEIGRGLDILLSSFVAFIWLH